MTDDVFDDLYCRLYIQFDGTLNILRKNITSYFGGSISIGSVFDEYVSINVMKNDGFLPDKIHEHAGFVYYPYTAEVEPTLAIMTPYAAMAKRKWKTIDTEIYWDVLCYVIRKLRENGAIVVASCEYENLIAEKTGWNWSEDTPNAPNLTLPS